MEKHRQVTEEDIIMTGELITRSYGRLKQSVVQAHSRALRCVGNTLKENTPLQQQVQRSGLE